MAREGDLNRLFRTFLNLKTTCKKASLSLYSEGSGNCQVTLRVTAPGHGYKTPRRGGDPSRSQEAAPGTLAPSSSSLPAAPTTAAAATAPAPARRARRRGPGALLRDERRRLARIEPNLLQPDPALPAARRQDAAMREAAPSLLLAPSEKERTPALPPPALPGRTADDPLLSALAPDRPARPRLLPALGPWLLSGAADGAP